MLAWMDEEALRRTRESGEAWFWSRSRETYWRKGETSGNTLAVEELREDCDADTILLRVRPAGPVCHTGAESCFAPWLWRVITERALQRPGGLVRRRRCSTIRRSLPERWERKGSKLRSRAPGSRISGSWRSWPISGSTAMRCWPRAGSTRSSSKKSYAAARTAASAPAAGPAPARGQIGKFESRARPSRPRSRNAAASSGSLLTRPAQAVEERLAVGLDAAGENGVGPAELEQVERLAERVQPRRLPAEGHVRAGEPEEDPQVAGVRVDDDVREARRVDERRPVREGDAVELDERLDACEPRPEDDGAALSCGRRRLRMAERCRGGDAGEPARAARADAGRAAAGARRRRSRGRERSSRLRARRAISAGRPQDERRVGAAEGVGVAEDDAELQLARLVRDRIPVAVRIGLG